MSGRITTGEPLAQFYQQDAKYLETRIGELHTHAIIHEGELCSKLNRARIAGRRMRAPPPKTRKTTDEEAQADMQQVPEMAR